MASNMSEPLVQCTLRDRYSQFARRVERSMQSTILAWQLRVYRTSCFFLCHLGFMKFVFGLLRRVRPVFIFKKLLVVTKASDVREVLARFDDFTLSQSIEPGMPWGTFLMTVDWPNQHAQERQLLQDAVHRTDIQKIRAIVAARCHDQIASARGQIDVVTELLEPVVVDIAKQYFGVPPLAGSPHKMALAMRDLAGIIMVDRPSIRSPGPARATASPISRPTCWLSFRARRRPLPRRLRPMTISSPDWSQRLRTRAGQPNWFDQDWIRRYLTGLLATGGATIVRAGAQAVDQLLAHPAALEKARATALELDRVEQLGVQEERAEQLRCTLRHFLYEALRFRPMLPLLIRDTPRETVIAYGTKRARIVPAGTKVIAPPLAAMFDPEEFTAPSDFNPSRPLEQYVHFGHGPRQCFGKYIAETTLIEIIRSLLVLPDLSRADGPKGRVAYEGPVAAGLVVTFNNHSKS